ncbi:MAG: hemerythrin domain-containing protein [Planctomycetales bacterium]|nr:hemerythrin domain-containing protein [Planctomycetales bacterium]
MKITECLNVEHGVFLDQLATLDHLVQQGAKPEVLAAVSRAIAGPVERHRELEERLLYPEIRRAWGPEFPPLDVMEREHEEIQDALRAIDSGRFDASTVNRFVDVLRQHIHKEVNVLFPMAEARIPAPRLEEMANPCSCCAHAGPEGGCGEAPECH